MTTQAPAITPVRIVAEHQLYGERRGGGIIPGKEYMTAVLETARETGHILDFNILAVHPGPFGLQLIQFEVDINVPALTERDEAKEIGKTVLLGKIFLDSADVRWATFIDRDLT